MKSRFITAMDLLQEETQKGDLTLKKVFQVIGEEGHGILLLFLCLPFIQPIPIPGLSTPFGIMISLVSFFHFLQTPPWLPKRFEKIHVSSKVVFKSSEVAERIWGYASKIIKQRLVFICENLFFRAISLVVVLVSAILLALPLPIPFSNTVPVISIVLSALGFIENDGVMILLSYLWMAVVISFFTALGIGIHQFI